MKAVILAVDEVLSEIILGALAVFSTVVGSILVFRSKTEDTTQKSAKWLVEELREDAEEARKRLDDMEAKLDQALKDVAACEDHRLEDRRTMDAMAAEIERLNNVLFEHGSFE